ncbi:MAG: UDP-3-O-(3-hydroxymyristoyl)glucosamine N-acyltransferase [Amphiplicatus sp.]
MPDSRFFLTREALAPEEAAAIAGAELVRSGAERIRRVGALDEQTLADAVVFIDAPRRAEAVAGRKIALCLTPKKAVEAVACDGALAAQDNPRLGFARLAARLHQPIGVGGAPGVDPAARLAENVRVHPSAVVAAGAEIGARSVVGPHAVIGPGVVIGEDAEIGAGVSVACALIGARVTILPGARIGEAGFGFIPGPDGFVRVPQLGRVRIGDDVDIGANTAIDRGAIGDTVIEDGVKIDNLVQIGHNVRIGRRSALAAQIGISGSTIVGARVMMGGQAGLADHLTIGDDVVIGAQAGLMHDIPAGERWGGTPARPMRTWLREVAVLTKLAMRKK